MPQEFCCAGDWRYHHISRHTGTEAHNQQFSGSMAGRLVRFLNRTPGPFSSSGSMNRSRRRVFDEANRIRVWADGSFDYVRDKDVRAWLLGNRVIEDLKSGLEFVRESYIRTMIKEGYLRLDRRYGFYWVTAKAAERFKLPKVMGCDFPPTERVGDR